ncbi:hypothetical protein [Streptomyces antibioticus]|uniref:hypothetical protein n=1 Tax=Streptomyces antibioticus TaxID=1890 RepID=UPI001FD8487D|nr:hypothetical protein [Streptomyces antibioticus]MCX5173672.1 hypothetical protein [Streptomyces antibioticus]
MRPRTEKPWRHGKPNERRTAITALGHKLRALVDAAARTTAGPSALNRVADDVHRLTTQLTERCRTRAESPEVDEFRAV